MAGLDESWQEALAGEFKKDYYRELYAYINMEYSKETVYPLKDEIFAAFNHTPLDRVKAVIIGQDPYHEPGQAEGLCFSVKKGVKLPPSLVNIYKELSSDIGCDIPESGSLVKWADQGVLLLNSILTVRAHQAMSHAGRGWEQFTDAVIDVLNKRQKPLVYILWGRPAGEKAKRVSNPDHLLLSSAHPSPLSAYRGFFGSRPFSKANEYLIKNNTEPVDWILDY